MTVPLNCAYCDHARRDHHHWNGSGLRPGGYGECFVRGCPCEKFAEQKPPPPVFACRPKDIHA